MKQCVSSVIAILGLYAVLGGTGYTQTIVSDTSVDSAAGVRCTTTSSNTVCKPIPRVPEIDATSSTLGLALAVVAMLLSAEVFRRRS
jgi:hypothetical protein